MKKLMNKVSQIARFVAPVPRSMARVGLAVVALVALCIDAMAQSTNFPDATVLYSQAATPFNTALTWSIGATAVLIVIAWIVRAMRRKG
jgi:hypothetical protein